jgi:hypothetical protein
MRQAGLLREITIPVLIDVKGIDNYGGLGVDWCIIKYVIGKQNAKI